VILSQCKITGEELIHSELELEIYQQFDAVPPPLTKKERLRLLFSYLSGGHFFWREVSGKKVYSVYPKSNQLSVIDASDYEGSEIALEYNPKESLISQIFTLLCQTTRPHFHGKNVNESFGVESVSNISKSSLVLFSGSSSGCFASEFVTNSTNIGSSLLVDGSDSCLSSYALRDCKRLAYSANCTHCNDSYFIANCVDSNFCILSSGLQGQEYYVGNEFVGKEGFEKALLELELHTSAGIELARSKFNKLVPRDSIKLRDFLNTGKNSSNIFSGVSISNCADLVGYSGEIKNSVLCVDCGDKAERLFNCIRCSDNVSDLTYCFDCKNSRELIGCVGIEGGEYLILNQQYSKSEYFKLKDEIITLLKRKRNWGVPMGFKFSDFAYNGSLAQHLFPLTRVQVGMFEIMWDEDVETLMVDRLLNSPEILEQIQDTPTKLAESIESSDGVFVCELSGRLFRFLPGELNLHQALKIVTSPYGHEERKRQLWQDIAQVL
jgi:hypothetical protein